MEEYYYEINNLVQNLLVPVRSSKIIDKKAFELFYESLNELSEKIKGEQYISRNIAGLLFFISRTLSEEAQGCNYTDDLFIAASKTENMVDKILWDSPFK